LRLDAGASANTAVRKWPPAPRDAYPAPGYQEQQVIVIPSRKSVSVRFGATTDRKAWSADSFIPSILMAPPSG
jgi:hypothetical protein